jgi:hypothetical protein
MSSNESLLHTSSKKLLPSLFPLQSQVPPPHRVLAITEKLFLTSAPPSSLARISLTGVQNMDVISPLSRIMQAAETIGDQLEEEKKKAFMSGGFYEGQEECVVMEAYKELEKKMRNLD